jgi:hypothetical protein
MSDESVKVSDEELVGRLAKQLDFARGELEFVRGEYRKLRDDRWHDVYARVVAAMSSAAHPAGAASTAKQYADAAYPPEKT